LAKGLPAYVHGLGKHACLAALVPGGRLHIEEPHVDRAIDGLIASSDRTFADVYEAATRSAQPDNLLRHVLTACALAKVDESGYFRPAAIKEPLSGILGRQVEIANFQNHLKAFIDPKRKAILQRDGEPRAYRFRFRQPAMQPFVLMKGMDSVLFLRPSNLTYSPPHLSGLLGVAVTKGVAIPSPTLRERRHCSLARRLVTVRVSYMLTAASRRLSPAPNRNRKGRLYHHAGKRPR
jgi:hypothetical protein